MPERAPIEWGGGPRCPLFGPEGGALPIGALWEGSCGVGTKVGWDGQLGAAAGMKGETAGVGAAEGQAGRDKAPAGLDIGTKDI